MAGKMNAPAAAEPMRKAYVTFLPGADDAREGLEAVVRLAEDLRKVGAAYQLVVAVLPDAPESHRRILVSQGCVVREVEPVYPPPEFSAMAAAPRYSMLRVWEFVEYERMVYLDAGIHVLANIDELFDLEEGHFYAAELGGPPPAARYFDAGTMFVHEPSAATAEALLHALRVARPKSFPEQDFMNMFFRDQYRPIPRLDHHLVVWTMVGYTEHAQVHEARLPWWGEMVPTFGSWLTTTAKVLTARQNLPAMAALTSSSASMGVVTGGAANPADCFSYYVVFITAIASLIFSLRNI